MPIDSSPIASSLNELPPLGWLQVRGSGTQETLFNSLIARYHYLGYCQTVGEHLKYLVYAGQRPIVCLAWGSAAWKVACRDRFVGWTHTLREQNLYPVVNNTRFLILPFVRVANLASYLLSQNIHRLLADRQRIYAHRGAYEDRQGRPISSCPIPETPLPDLPPLNLIGDLRVLDQLVPLHSCLLLPHSAWVLQLPSHPTSR